MFIIVIINCTYTIFIQGGDFQLQSDLATVARGAVNQILQLNPQFQPPHGKKAYATATTLLGVSLTEVYILFYFIVVILLTKIKKRVKLQLLSKISGRIMLLQHYKHINKSQIRQKQHSSLAKI